MPIIRLTATQANEYRKTNAYRSWGDRASPNRVEPITRPGFRVPFKMQPGSRIFTVGSCFARNVEDELIRRSPEWDATVVITHFAPSARSADPRYGLQSGTASFCNADDELITRADLWIHGHLHCVQDYRVSRAGATCRVVSNARGHAAKGESARHRPQLVLDV